MNAQPLLRIALVLACGVGLVGAGATRPMLRPTLGMLTGPGEVVSGPDGTATVSFTIGGYGSGTCKATLHAYSLTNKGFPYANAGFEITAASGFPKVVALKLPRPDLYRIVTEGPIGGLYTESCQGKLTKDPDLKVKPHPDFPCSLYPGYKKETLGALWLCSPPMTPPKVDSFGYLCEGGAKFVNANGLIFGCVPPGTFY